MSREILENMVVMVQPRTFNPVLAKLRRLVIDSRCNPQVVTAIVGSDPMIAATLVARAHYAASGGNTNGRLIASINTIGISGLAGLLEEVAPLTGPQATALAPCWSHASATSTLACLLAKHCEPRKLESDVDQDLIATAGLIHDIGSILIILSQSDRYHHAGRRLIQGEGPLRTLLGQELGMEPQGIGLLWARNNGLPPILKSVIGLHHAPQRASEFPGLTHLIHLARNLAIACGHAAGVDVFVDTIDPKILETLGLNIGHLRKTLEEYRRLDDDLSCYETYLAQG